MPTPWWRRFVNRLPSTQRTPPRQAARRTAQLDVFSLEVRYVPSTISFIKALGSAAQFQK